MLSASYLLPRYIGPSRACRELDLCLCLTDATVTRDGEVVYSSEVFEKEFVGPHDYFGNDMDPRTFPWGWTFEEMALLDPDHDWQIVRTPLMRTLAYQRHDVGWELIHCEDKLEEYALGPIEGVSV